ncbi:hypothetical protein HID58_032021 [Brassica napus]|uniref:Uncharacterized protein n=1 Tax=Brassica napus TaxID=3708 RepID=A0ABQ8BV50_BRANA|nr:hypothetical protein HID58_032021 [Brassica napus]
MGWEWVCRWFQFRVGVSGKVASFCCRFRFRSGPLVQCGGESWQWCAGVFLFRLMAAGLEDALTSSHARQCGALNLSCPFRIRATAGVVNSFSSGGSRWMSCLLVWLCGVAIRAAQA